MIIKQKDAPIFTNGGTRAVGYASPSRGARDTSLWRIELAPNSSSPPHQLEREEVFLLLAGSACARFAEHEENVCAGDCRILPADTEFLLPTNDDGCEAVVCMPAGSHVTILPEGQSLIPPWAE